MSEHDAATVARATVWLDTSNEVRTKRRSAGEQLATARELPCDETATLIWVKPDRGLRDRAFVSIRRHRTAVACCVTAIALSLWLAGDSSGSRHRAKAPSSLARSAGPAIAAGSDTRDERALHDASTSELSSSLPRANAEAKPSASPIEASAEAPASLHDAVEALARGEYPRALALYRSLARENPHDAAFAVVTEILRAREAVRCARARAGEAPCDG